MKARRAKRQASELSIANTPSAANSFPSARHPQGPPEGNGVLPSAQTGRGIGEVEIENRVSLSQDLYVCLLQVYCKRKALAEGKKIHALFVQDGLDADPHVGNLLINLYTTCCSITDARAVFNRMPAHDIYAWTMMISGSATAGYAQDAMALHKQMELEGAQLDRVSCLAVLKACAIEGALLQEHAWQVFDTMPNRDAISWNIMIAGFARVGHTKEAFSFFRNMEKEQFEPDEEIWIFILRY